MNDINEIGRTEFGSVYRNQDSEIIVMLKEDEDEEEVRVELWDIASKAVSQEPIKAMDFDLLTAVHLGAMLQSIPAVS